MSHPPGDLPRAPGPAGLPGAAAARLRSALPRPTRRCVLRAADPGDVAALQAYRGLAEVTRFLGHPPLDLEGMAHTLAGWLADDATLTVVSVVEGRVVGDVRLDLRPAAAMPPAVTPELEARLGYAFHPSVHGRGLATEAVREVVGLAVLTGMVRRVTARVFAPATPSSRLLGRLGFHLDGVDRQAVLAPDGATWWDDECWSLLRDEWAADPGAPSR